MPVSSALKKRPGLVSAAQSRFAAPQPPADVKVLREGIWELTYADSKNERKAVLAVKQHLQSAYAGLLKPFRGLPLIFRVVREIVSDDRQGYVVLVTWFIARLSQSLIPSIQMSVSNSFSRALDRVIQVRHLPTELKPVLVRLLAQRIGLAVLANVIGWLEQRAEEDLSMRMRKTFSAKVLKAFLSLSVESSTQSSAYIDLSRAANLVGLTTGGRGNARFSMLVGGFNAFEILSTASQTLVLSRILRRQTTDRAFAFLGVLECLLNNRLGRRRTRRYLTSLVVDEDFLKERSMTKIGTSSNLKSEVEALGLAPYVSRKFSEASAAFGSKSPGHPHMMEFRSFAGLPRAWHLVSQFRMLPTYYAAYKAIYHHTAPFPITSARQVMSQASGVTQRIVGLFYAGSMHRHDKSSADVFAYETLLNLDKVVRKLVLPDGDLPLAQTETGLSIEFIDVVFKYPGHEKPALDGVSFKIESGDLVIFAGANGCGKSTSLKLLCRLYDVNSGQILIDGIDIKRYRLADLRSRMAICWQEHVHFPVTFAEDISYGDIETAEADPSSIEEAARRGGAYDFIKSMPEGFETTMRELEQGEHDDPAYDIGAERPAGAHPVPKPVKLSGGQWQRLALSRTMMRAPRARVLAFDEPSASLDPKAEFELFERLDAMREGRTTLYISHRFGTFNKKANRIFLMDHGKVVEQGTHAELVDRQDGMYAKLYRYQAKSFGQ